MGGSTAPAICGWCEARSSFLTPAQDAQRNINGARDEADDGGSPKSTYRSVVPHPADTRRLSLLTGPPEADEPSR